MSLRRNYDASPNAQNSAKQALSGEIQGWITMIKDIVANLPEVANDAPNGKFFKYIADKNLTPIAVTLRRYKDTKRQSYFNIFKTSESVRDFAGATLKQIDAAAKLFEGYQKKPSSYSKHKAVTTLEATIDQLVNLRDEVLTKH